MIEIIPAIDLIDGKCVRLSQGDYAQKTVYNENPLEVAKMFADAGIRRLHLVDLNGAKAHHIVNQKVLERITAGTDLIVDFGGGLKSAGEYSRCLRDGENPFHWAIGLHLLHAHYARHSGYRAGGSLFSFCSKTGLAGQHFLIGNYLPCDYRSF